MACFKTLVQSVVKSWLRRVASALGQLDFNGLRLGVCYFALQILQSLDKFNRQNNSTKPLLVAGAVN